MLLLGVILLRIVGIPYLVHLVVNSSHNSSRAFFHFHNILAHLKSFIEEDDNNLAHCISASDTTYHCGHHHIIHVILAHISSHLRNAQESCCQTLLSIVA